MYPMLGADFKAEDCCRIWARDLRSGLQRRYAFVHFSSQEHAEEFTKKAHLAFAVFVINLETLGSFQLFFASKALAGRAVSL